SAAPPTPGELKNITEGQAGNFRARGLAQTTLAATLKKAAMDAAARGVPGAVSVMGTTAAEIQTALAADTSKTEKRLSDMSSLPAADLAKAVAGFLKDMKKSTDDLNKAAKDAKSSYDAAVRTGVKPDIAKKLGEYVKASAVA